MLQMTLPCVHSSELCCPRRRVVSCTGQARVILATAGTADASCRMLWHTAVAIMCQLQSAYVAMLLFRRQL